MSAPKSDKIIAIPVKPHVKTFLEHSSNLGKGPYEIRKDHWLGELITAIFSFHPLTEPEIPADYLPEKTVKLPTVEIIPKFRINRQLLTDEHLNKVGLSMEVMFKHALIFYARGRMSLLNSEQGAVNCFYKEYGIDTDDYDTSAAFKVVNRAKDAR
ncbi:hypothetical protein P1X15_07275 [Runella sp. MFBS21]|uniref:hypothetical protein n=1 Tax=Runella sp. MFBS21 TaxID=3034018 RepID=UPI0023F66463|nr:hypothetical protein [Runella sp. MFBS21]MDF7817388.1 hypothetical protein [Runella sp. MFBS21]